METNLPAAITKMQVTDVGKVLFLFRAADLAKVSIEERDIDSIVFLLQVERVIPFDYAFRLNPLPRCPRLHEDVYDLIQTRYLAKTSPIYITAEGSNWVTKFLEYHEYTVELLQPVVDQIKGLVGGGRDSIFRLVYAAITR